MPNPIIDHRGMSTPPTPPSPLLRVEHITKRFPVGKGQALYAVDDLSFTLEAGESVGLVGESGCGKSTLIRLISRLLSPTSGTISFNGQRITDIPLKQFVQHPARAQLQMVFQDPTDSLNPRFTAFDTITEPLKRLGQIRDPHQLRLRAEELADWVGLPSALLSRYPHQLSGGQKARVGIARAITLDPKLLILDEPTSALDVSVQAIILHLLADLQASLGMSYLFVSHDLNVVRLLCDRIMVMYLGKLVETGTTEALLQHPRHPYTQALITAIPSFEAKPKPIPLAGEPRSPINPNPNVCRLNGRCERGEDRCHQEMPTLRSAGSQAVACHFPLG